MMKYGLLPFIVLLLGLSVSADGKTHLEPSSLITNDLGMQFVLIHPGTFMMGSPENEEHRRKNEVLHQVTLTKPFLMQITEVTQGQWKALMGRNPSNSYDCGLNCPVESVSWLDCQEFVRKLNARGKDKYRLPTEAEWEYACRAGTDTPYYWGSSIDCTRAMYANNTLKAPGTCVAYARKKNLLTDSPAPVKTFPPNAWGIYDMAGNVWEWCQDWYGPYPMESVVDPGGPPSGHKKVRRGGSFFKYGWYCRSANRNAADEYDRLRTLGFRLIMIVP